MSDDYELADADLPLAALFAGWAMADEVQRRIAADGMGDLRLADGVVFQHLVPGPIAIGALAERLGVSQQAASKAVADLERRGYVERVTGAEDGRVRHVSLTDRGRAAIEAGRATAPRCRTSSPPSSGRGGPKAPAACSPRSPPNSGGCGRARPPRATSALVQVTPRCLYGPWAAAVGWTLPRPWGGFLASTISCSAAVMAAALVLAAPAGAADWSAGSPSTGDPFFLQMGNGGNDVQHYSLDLDYDPATEVLDGSTRITLIPTQDLDQFNLDLRDWFAVSRVAVGKQRAAYFQEDGQELVITPRPNSTRAAPTPSKWTTPACPRTWWTRTRALRGGSRTPTARSWSTSRRAPRAGSPSTTTRTTRRPTTSRSPCPRATSRSATGACSPPSPTAARRPGAGARTRRWPATSRLPPTATSTSPSDTGPNGLPIYNAIDSKGDSLATDGFNAAQKVTAAQRFAAQPQIISVLTELWGPYPFTSAGAVFDRGHVGYALESQTKPMYDGVPEPDHGRTRARASVVRRQRDAVGVA